MQTQRGGEYGGKLHPAVAESERTLQGSAGDVRGPSGHPSPCLLKKTPGPAAMTWVNGKELSVNLHLCNCQQALELPK